jgi:hypothetical protein
VKLLLRNILGGLLVALLAVTITGCSGDNGNDGARGLAGGDGVARETLSSSTESEL